MEKSSMDLRACISMEVLSNDSMTVALRSISLMMVSGVHKRRERVDGRIGIFSWVGFGNCS